MRVLILKQLFGDNLLFITDATNEQLEMILQKAVDYMNDGEGKSLTDVCDELFEDVNMNEVGEYGPGETDFLDDARKQDIISYEDYTIYTVRS